MFRLFKKYQVLSMCTVLSRWGSLCLCNYSGVLVNNISIVFQIFHDETTLFILAILLLLFRERQFL